jgi:hypothetical protein
VKTKCLKRGKTGSQLSTVAKVPAKSKCLAVQIVEARVENSFPVYYLLIGAYVVYLVTILASHRQFVIHWHCFSHYFASIDKHPKRSHQSQSQLQLQLQDKAMPSWTMKVALTTALLISAISQVVQGQNQVSNKRQNHGQAPAAVQLGHIHAVSAHASAEESADAKLNEGYSRGSAGQAAVDTAAKTIMDPSKGGYGVDSFESRKLRGKGKRGGKSGKGKKNGKGRSEVSRSGATERTSSGTSKSTSKGMGKRTSKGMGKGMGKQSKSTGE